MKYFTVRIQSKINKILHSPNPVKLEDFKSLSRALIARLHILAGSCRALSRATVAASGSLMHFLILGVKCFLVCNFGSRHARRSSKVSIDAGDYLVSKKSFGQNFGPSDWRPEPVKVGQITENTPTLRARPRQTPHPNQNFFFIEPRRLAASVEGLNNSLAIAAGEL